MGWWTWATKSISRCIMVSMSLPAVIAISMALSHSGHMPNGGLQSSMLFLDIADFHKLITQGYFYTDRTDRIASLEQADDHLLFLRPRWFGKSLVLSMLENYYDVAKSDEFEWLFGHLEIGQNPTPLHNRYFVMRWGFSAVMTHGDTEAIGRALHNHINACVRSFIMRYHDILPQMRTFYNGYRFGYEDGPLLYNPTLALYFLDEYQRDCTYPRAILDSNLAMDRNCIEYIAALPHGDELVTRSSLPPIRP